MDTIKQVEMKKKKKKRVSQTILNCTRKNVDQRTRKPMMLYKALHARDDIGSMSRKGGGRELASKKDSVDGPI